MRLDRLLARVRAALGEPLAKSLRRRLRAAAPSRIAELREGLHCRVSGTIRTYDNLTLEAPLSGRPCVAYLLEVVETTAVQRDLIVYDKRAVPFLVAEAGHHAIVEPTHVELVVASAHQLTSTVGRLKDPRQFAVLKRYCADRVSWEVSTQLQFRELAILPGQQVTIAGVGRREVDPEMQAERGYRDAIQDRLRFVGAPHLPLLIGDDPA